MKILLTTPPMQHFNVSGVVFSGFGAYNLARLAAMLVPRHQVLIRDYLVLRFRPHTLDQDIRSFQPDVVAIANPFAGYTAVVSEMARRVKSLRPETVLVTGGQAATYLWERHLQGGFDFVVRFEGERTFRALIEMLEARGDPTGVAGLAFWSPDGHARLTALRPYVEDLDSLPWAARSLALERRGILTPGKAGLMEISRGCPYHCSFCSQPGFWGLNRRRSNEAILEELAWLVRDGYTEICFTDDTVGVDHADPHAFPEETASLLEGLLKRNLKVRLGFCMRADTAARFPEFVRLAARAGLLLVNMGFESYTRGGLAALGKKEVSLEINEAASRVLRENGVLIWGSHIYGAPSQTDADMAATTELGPRYSDFFRMTMASPLPGSAAFLKMQRAGLVDEQASTQVTYYHYAYQDGRDPRKVQREYLKHLARYYLHPENVVKMVDPNPPLAAMARQSYKGAAFFGMHKVLGLVGLSRL